LNSSTVLNAELAALSDAPQFAPKLTKTRKILLEAIAKEHKK
jgi:hypothetical protein